MTECFFCGEEIVSEPVISYDKIRNRTLYFCSEFCRDNQIGGKHFPHYTKFPRTRKIRKQVWLEEMRK